MKRLRQFWEQLAPRDQRVLASGALLLLLIGGWRLLWEPLREARDDWRQRLAAAQADHAFMRAAVPQLQALEPAAPVRDGRSLLALVDATARQSGAGTALLQVEPVSSAQVRVHFQGAAFDTLVQWLDQLSREQGVWAAEFSVNRSAGAGRVDARITLERNEGTP